MSDRTRVGVVGCGLVAQVMHLPYLHELSDRFEIAALCDLSEEVAVECARRYGVQRIRTTWQELVTDPLDAVLIASSGDHAPIAIAASEAGMHVFVEKPMALCSQNADEMIAAAERSGTRLMVGTMKRYDPAYERLAELLPRLRDLRLVSVTTLESPCAPYVSHYPLIKGSPPDPTLLADARRSERRAVEAAIGGADEQTRQCYRVVLLGTLVHEINALQGLLGEPSAVTSSTLSPRCVGVTMRFGEAECHLSWVDLPGIARYRQSFAFYAPQQRLTLELPSPFLRSMPSRLIVEGGEPGSSHSWEREEIVSYDEAFKRELIEFSECIRSGRKPRTCGEDGLRDIRLLERIARVQADARARPGAAASGAGDGGASTARAGATP